MMKKMWLICHLSFMLTQSIDSKCSNRNGLKFVKIVTQFDFLSWSFFFILIFHLALRFISSWWYFWWFFFSCNFLPPWKQMLNLCSVEVVIWRFFIVHRWNVIYPSVLMQTVLRFSTVFFCFFLSFFIILSSRCHVRADSATCVAMASFPLIILNK